MIDPYNDTVRAAFANPVHAGDLDRAYGRVLRAAMSASAGGARVELSAGVDDGKIAAVRFRAWGCPHLIAAAEWAAAQLEGQALGSVRPIRSNDLAAALSVPVTKSGLMLLVEDAIDALLSDEEAGKED